MTIKNLPNVYFNEKVGELRITGRSFPENPIDFYNPLIESVKNLTVDSLSVTIEVDYLNTSSTKCILELLKTAKNTVNDLVVVWINEEGDDDMQELGEYFEECLDLEFDFRVFVK